MLAIKFNELLNQKEAFDLCNIHELENLVNQYPYAYMLKVLLLKKYKAEGKENEFKQLLKEAAFYATRETKLTDCFSELEEIEGRGQKEQNSTFDLPLTPPVWGGDMFSEESNSQEPQEIQVKNAPVLLNHSYEAIQSWLENFKPPRRISKKVSTSNKKIYKLPKMPIFDANMLDFLATEEVKEVPVSKRRKEKKQVSKEEKKIEFLDLFEEKTTTFLESFSFEDKKGEEESAEYSSKELLQQSLEENDEIISETLADLLAIQGKKEKAIKMYKGLSLKFPEKSTLFAQKIKELEA